MSRPDEGLIHMWLDGECSAEEAARVERLVASDPAWAAAVAEARGLIAASSRIVSALDAVPAGVVPAGSKAAPEFVAEPARELPTHDGFRVRPWMKMAAGLVLVVGTAYAIRGTTREAFGPRGEVQTAASPATPVEELDSAVTADAGTRAAPVAGQAAERVGNLASAPSAGAGVRSTARADEPMVAKTAPVREQPSARAQAAAPSLVPVGPPAVETPAPAAGAPAAPAAGASTGAAGAPAPRAVAAMPATSAEDRARRLTESERRFAAGALSQVVTTGTRGEVTLKSPDSRSLMSSEAMQLNGCWNITAPDSLRTILRNPTFRRVTDDTLMLQFVFGVERKVRVVQNDDTLRGEITAKRVECPKP